jgi:hypothetical protein
MVSSYDLTVNESSATGSFIVSNFIGNVLKTNKAQEESTDLTQ